GRSLARAWAQAAEAAADEHAARENPDRALNLASALVTIAKMVPVKERAEVPLGAYLIGVEETQGVKARIRRLLDIASHGIDNRDHQSLIRAAQVISLLGFLLFATAAAANPKVLIGVHELIERTVSLLCYACLAAPANGLRSQKKVTAANNCAAIPNTTRPSNEKS